MHPQFVERQLVDSRETRVSSTSGETAPRAEMDSGYADRAASASRVSSAWIASSGTCLPWIDQL